MLPEGRGWLVAEFGGDTVDEARAAAQKLIDAYKGRSNATSLIDSKEDQEALWTVRESALGATAHVPDMPETHPGWEDSAVPRDKLGDYLRDLKTLFHKYGYEASVYGHFGDGLIHCRVDFDLRTEEGLENWRAFLDEAADLVVGYGGSLSGEHGDGQARAELLEKMYGPELVTAFREFKAIWDPEGRMNPGKVVDPYPITSNLRFGPTYQPDEVATRFAYREDGGSFVKATRRCVGVGACRRRDSEKSVMCPSYMATGEEKYSTRGRARLLFEMLHGGAIEDRWRSDEVEEALDLCLACKGCKSDCPVHVDMATYKAEFRSHYYAGRLRPRAAYSMGLIHRWARIASHMPLLANAATQLPGISALAKWAGGIAQERQMPKFARAELHRLVQRPRQAPVAGGKRVLLWPDTFNNYFRPDTAIAADPGARSPWLRRRHPVRTALLRPPALRLGHARRRHAAVAADPAGARRRNRRRHADRRPRTGLRQRLQGRAPRPLPRRRAGRPAQPANRLLLRFPRSARQRLRPARPSPSTRWCSSIATTTRSSSPRGETSVLDRLGLDYAVMKSGCCGMAGSFGFEADKYDVSMRAARRSMVPTIEAAPADTLILANGFSCREQIEQTTARKTSHTAEVIARALNL